MIEINRLRTRILNSGKNAREYKMTMDDARALLNEIDDELQKAAKKIIHVTPPVPDPVAVQHIIMDGGSFEYPSISSPPLLPLQELPRGILVKKYGPIEDQDLTTNPIKPSQE